MGHLRLDSLPRHKIAEAEPWIRAAWRNGNSAEAGYHLAILLEKQGHPTEAVNQLELASKGERGSDPLAVQKLINDETSKLLKSVQPTLKNGATMQLQQDRTYKVAPSNQPASAGPLSSWRSPPKAPPLPHRRQRPEPPAPLRHHPAPQPQSPDPSLQPRQARPPRRPKLPYRAHLPTRPRLHLNRLQQLDPLLPTGPLLSF